MCWGYMVVVFSASALVPPSVRSTPEVQEAQLRRHIRNVKVARKLTSLLATSVSRLDKSSVQQVFNARAEGLLCCSADGCLVANQCVMLCLHDPVSVLGGRESWTCARTDAVRSKVCALAYAGVKGSLSRAPHARSQQPKVRLRKQSSTTQGPTVLLLADLSFTDTECHCTAHLMPSLTNCVST